ncbi:MAG TPA: hypothetical protein VFB45_19480 [Pseudolabrys sp.]|nr:hypothetical protein [Pseudolabrys sp.]
MTNANANSNSNASLALSGDQRPPEGSHRFLHQRRAKEREAARIAAQAVAAAAAGNPVRAPIKPQTFASYTPVPKQQEFHEAGSGFNERLPRIAPLLPPSFHPVCSLYLGH